VNAEAKGGSSCHTCRPDAASCWTRSNWRREHRRRAADACRGGRPRNDRGPPGPRSRYLLAPTLACEQLLRAEGFTDIRYVPGPAGAPVYAALDFGASLPPAQLKAIETGMPVTVIGGIHVGCYELFANGSIRSIVDLKGKAVGLQAAPRDLLTLMAAHVGLDPVSDFQWVTDPKVKPLELFAPGKIDGFLGFPPEPQELRARKAGHVILSTARDRPWSEYFCCMIAANSEFLRAYPVATKRLLRAILKGHGPLCHRTGSRGATDRGWRFYRTV
jgi:NitT/TauT family transport system substrate-binding protein